MSFALDIDFKIPTAFGILKITASINSILMLVEHDIDPKKAFN